MSEPTKLPVKTASSEPTKLGVGWLSLRDLQRQVDRLFEDFGGSFRMPAFQSAFGEGFDEAWSKAVASDIVEKEKSYEITAELPGIDEKDIEIQLAHGLVTIKGEKKQEKEEKLKDYHLSERRFGSFQRSFRVPDSVDSDKIEASFKKGVLTLILPKTADAQKAPKKISVKAA